MERAICDTNILKEFVLAFTNVLEKHTPYIIVSGFVAIASGRTRGTEDIDMIIPPISESKFAKLHEELIVSHFVCMQSSDPVEIYEYLKEKLSVRYTWQDKPLPEMEIKFAKDEIDLYQLQTKQKLPLTGIDVWFSSVNINIAFKEEYLKSDKDLEDARHLRIVYSDLINEDEISYMKKLIRKLRL